MAIGTAAGLSAVILLHGIKIVGSWRLMLAQQYSAPIALPLFGMIGGLIAGICVQFAPEVSGSGIPQVRALLSRISLPLDFKQALVKLFSGIVALGAGLVMGREGPTVQVGAALAATLSRLLPTTAEHRRQLIAAGAGAGLAAAFNAPIAGVTFVLEELLKEVSPSIISLSLVACFSAAVVLNLVGNAREHSVITTAGPAVPVHLQDIVFYILLGLLCAFFGAVFNGLIMAFLRLYKRSRLPVWARTAVAGLVTGAVVSLLPVAFHDYAAARQLISAGSVAPDMVPIAFVAFFFLVLLAYGSGSPGGLFAPALMLGSCLGYMIGYIHWQYLGINLIDVFTQVGMGALFAAVARVPLTATVIVFEMSGNFGLIPPLMIASVIGSSVGELLSKGSVYDSLMIWSGINLKGPAAFDEANSLRVFDIMDKETSAISDQDTAKNAVSWMDSHGRDGCPVVSNGMLVGIITRDAVELSRKHNESSHSDMPVKALMSAKPVTVSPYDTLEEILFLFTRYQYQWLSVADDGKFMGTVTREAVLSRLFPQSAQSPT